MTDVTLCVKEGLNVNIGLVGVIVDAISMIGTENIEGQELVRRGYKLDNRCQNIALKDYYHGNERWSVCYRREPCGKTFNLLSIYRELNMR